MNETTSQSATVWSYSNGTRFSGMEAMGYGLGDRNRQQAAIRHAEAKEKLMRYYNCTRRGRLLPAHNVDDAMALAPKSLKAELGLI